MCYSSRVEVEVGGLCIISGTQTGLSHGLPLCSAALRPLIHTVNSALCLAAWPFVLARLLCPDLFGRGPVSPPVLQASPGPL